MNGADLLQRYRTTASEEAFAGLVHGYANLVYSVAKRRLSEMALAEDATQTVFTRLATALPKIKTDAELMAWLHRTTVHVSIDLWRSETRRRTREQEAVVMQSDSTENNQAWDEIAPHLDEALNELNDADRQAVLLRFFERKPMQQIGRIFGVSEDAAKMRVSRAIERLRSQLQKRGTTCAVALVVTVLTERAVEAAPASVLTKLRTISISTKTAAPFVRLIQSTRIKFLGAACAIGVFLFLASRWRGPMNDRNADQPVQTQSEMPKMDAPLPPPVFKPLVARQLNAFPITPSKPRVTLRVVDVNTDQGLAGAQIRAAYFYAGGRGEGHTLVTDRNGEALIPQPNEGGNPGMNVFFSVEGYVAKAFGFDGSPPAEYVFKAQPALMASGIVVDEQGTPVAKVILEALRSEDYNDDAPNTDFQTTKVETDAKGHWRYHYIPTNYDQVGFNLTADGYAISAASVNMRTAESTNAVLVLKRGFVVVGTVTDFQGSPIVNAKVKDFHNYGHRKLSTKTDANGWFVLAGVSTPHHLTAEIVVEAEHMAPQLKSIELSQPTNTIDFVLGPGSVFRGHVVDESGQPLPGVAARTDSDKQGRRPFEWFTHTDAQGSFVWDAAPTNSVLVWFEADGYEAIRALPVMADGREYEIKLKREAR